MIGIFYVLILYFVKYLGDMLIMFICLYFAFILFLYEYLFQSLLRNANSLNLDLRNEERLKTTPLRPKTSVAHLLLLSCS